MWLPSSRGLALAAGPPIRPPPPRPPVPPDLSLLYADYVDGRVLRGSGAPASGTDSPQGGTVSSGGGSGEDGSARTRSVTIGVLAGTLGLLVLGEWDPAGPHTPAHASRRVLAPCCGWSNACCLTSMHACMHASGQTRSSQHDAPYMQSQASCWQGSVLVRCSH